MARKVKRVDYEPIELWEPFVSQLKVQQCPQQGQKKTIICCLQSSRRFQYRSESLIIYMYSKIFCDGTDTLKLLIKGIFPILNNNGWKVWALFFFCSWNTNRKLLLLKMLVISWRSLSRRIFLDKLFFAEQILCTSYD